MDERTYRRMTLGCSCGHIARSYAAEARHRHNFPLLCRRPRRDPQTMLMNEWIDGLTELRQLGSVAPASDLERQSWRDEWAAWRTKRREREVANVRDHLAIARAARQAGAERRS